ncbi:alkyl hydroperoxide reductase/ Thiol specific antioxidant/ Mal allergen [Paludibacter propionicigenes WB4]|jgi:peroxiredoxin 2/4|uniref:Alkyl hydroperoxide reductase/ Thiol specific antioxidant/ Mal allergen n=1 Tax=Paludibacter propionicigenes (strain DSM 17365 / JCM 13257 / WB4) TaxID=694427 RepID=E4T411_PALPW|nr:peroxiredoxin [Paludibacter propionicigenes]ADQ79455.1 alkyl hydroperoxide reductase/ Thiol specific antioxidant/ Mal allergen [Paludibacter propionicigenes WB4]
MSVLVGKKAPVFNSKAVVNGGEIVENFSLEQFVGEKYVVFFFYPADFTFVCPTELIAFEDKAAEFAARNTVVIGASTDSEFSHWKWLQTPQNQGGIQGVTYPLVVDQNLSISKNYDVLIGSEEYDEEGNESFVGEPKAYRGLFLIDKQGVVRHQLVNDLPLGRNVDEVLRLIDALQFTEEYGEVCPANWKKGEKALVATQEGIASYLSEKA